jgi:hypothetical protein
VPVDRDTLESLATDLHQVWEAPSSEMPVKQRIARLLIQEIVANTDEPVREIVLVIHWVGGRHSEVRLPRPKPGEHRHRTGPDAEGVVRRLAGAWPDHEIAACLNRRRLRTGAGNTWTASRVLSLRKRLHPRGLRRGRREAHAHALPSSRSAQRWSVGGSTSNSSGSRSNTVEPSLHGRKLVEQLPAGALRQSRQRQRWAHEVANQVFEPIPAGRRHGHVGVQAEAPEPHTARPCGRRGGGRAEATERLPGARAEGHPTLEGGS